MYQMRDAAGNTSWFRSPCPAGMLPYMELRHLRYFVAVAEEENVTRAAARLRVAQPSLSRQIRDLEGELGVELFDHAARALRLTPAGRHFLQEAREAISRVDEAVRSVREYAHGEHGEIHIGYSPTLSSAILPHALRRFQNLYPKVQVRLHDLSTAEMLAGLRARDLGAALLVRPRELALEGLSFQEIVRFRPAVALPPAHPLAALSSVSVEQLLDQPLIAYNDSEYPEHRAWLERIFAEKTMPKVVAEFDSFSSLITSVESGCGVAIVQMGFENLVGSRLEIRPIRDLEGGEFSFGVAQSLKDESRLTKEFVASCLSCSELVQPAREA